MDVQLAHFDQVVQARALLRADLLRDEEPIRDAREVLSTLYNSALTPEKRLNSLYYLMEEVEERRRNKAATYKERAHKSNWVPPTYSFYAEKWTMATVASMNNARLPVVRRNRPVFSPFVVLPRHIRATAPHQGTPWWEVGPANPRYDFLQLRQDTLNDTTNLCEGKLRTFDEGKNVRILVYNWDTVNYNAGDVNSRIMQLGLPIVDELSPRTGGKNPLLDVRVDQMDIFLWEMLNARTGCVGEFHFSIRMAVGVDDDSAKLHAWAELTFEGRKRLTPEDIPDRLAHLVYKQSGVEIALNTQSLDSEWLQATNYSGRFDIAVRQESDWRKLQKIPVTEKLLHITEVTGMGTVLGLVSGKGKLHIASAMGPYVLQLVEMPGRSPEGPISRLLLKHGITLFGFKREEKGYRCTISLGFSSDPQRTSASIYSPVDVTQESIEGTRYRYPTSGTNPSTHARFATIRTTNRATLITPKSQEPRHRYAPTRAPSAPSATGTLTRSAAAVSSSSTNALLLRVTSSWNSRPPFRKGHWLPSAVLALAPELTQLQPRLCPLLKSANSCPAVTKVFTLD